MVKKGYQAERTPFSPGINRDMVDLRGTLLRVKAAESRIQPDLRPLFARVLGGDLAATPVWFEMAVIDDYRTRAGWRLLRTNTVGRVRSPDGWSLDFGIVDDGKLIHVPVGDLSQRLPASERQHWIDHLVAPAASRNFILMRLGAAACIDDGELRDWQD